MEEGGRYSAFGDALLEISELDTDRMCFYAFAHLLFQVEATVDYRIHKKLQYWVPKIHKAYKRGTWARMSKDPEADSALEAFGYLQGLIEKDGITVSILGLEEPDRVYFLIYDVHNIEIGSRTTPTGTPYGMDCFFNKAPDRDAYLAHFPPPFTHEAFVSWLEDVFAESAVPFDFSKTRFE